MLPQNSTMVYVQHSSGVVSKVAFDRVAFARPSSGLVVKRLKYNKLIATLQDIDWTQPL